MDSTLGGNRMKGLNSGGALGSEDDMVKYLRTDMVVCRSLWFPAI